MTKKILIADDETRIRILLKDFLARQNYFILEAKNGQEALDIFFEEPNINLIILDIMMPLQNGWEVCTEIRKISNIPIIMLTAKGEELYELQGFNLGADEYIAKPFSPSILAARVNALLRRTQNKTKKYNFGNLKIDNDLHLVTLYENEIDLSPKEYELLLYLIENKGAVLSREQLLNNVWGYTYYGSLRTVDTHINRLRIKLGNDCNYIKTKRSYGYKFEV